MNYQQTLDYLFSCLPMFHRIGAAAYKADLKNTTALCSLLNHPEKDFGSIHIAGTNGKGSTSHIIASILQQSGLKTGLFTSPHLKDFRERIRINGRMISKRDVVTFVKQHKAGFNTIQPSFFEWTFALAAWYFAKEKVDLAVLETGMGGRLDSTNVVTPVISIITNIGFDHTQFLGSSLAAIAGEKAGIIKPGIPVIIGETQAETEAIFVEISNKLGSEIYFADRLLIYNEPHYTRHRLPLLGADYHSLISREAFPIRCPLTGRYQLKNLATTICTIENLQKQGYKIRKKDIISGIRNVVKNTGLMGRWQTISQSPLTIADIGHNPDGIREVLDQVSLTAHHKLHIVIGVVNDKDVRSILGKLPKNAIYYFCKANIPRGMDATELGRLAEDYSLQGKVFVSVKEALLAAQLSADSDDLVLVSGSAFVVAEVV